jgi:hypothetical protein
MSCKARYYHQNSPFIRVHLLLEINQPLPVTLFFRSSISLTKENKTDSLLATE